MNRDNRPQDQKIGLSAWKLVLLYFSVATAPMGLAVFGGTAPADVWAEAGAASGMIGTTVLMLQFVASGRFETLSGRIGTDTTMGFHKFAAPVALAVLFAHPVFFAAPVDFSDLQGFSTRLSRMFLSPHYLTGVIGLGVFTAMIILAKWRDNLPFGYTFWRASHGISALLLVGLALLHIRSVGTYSQDGALSVFWPLLAAAVIFPVLGVYTTKVWKSSRQGWQISGKRRIAERLWEVTLDQSTQTPLAFRAGQFAWITIGKWHIPLFDNPFSISSGPKDGHRLRFIIQEAGDLTRTIADLEVGQKVGMDAPHGAFTHENLETDAILLVAGGVGISPILAILNDLADCGDTRPIRLLYSARSAETMIDRSELAPHLDRLNVRSVFLTDDATPSSGFERGPIGRSHLVHALSGLDPAQTGAMICGPGKMMSASADTLFELGIPLKNILFERFQYQVRGSSRKDKRIMLGFILIGVAIAAAGTAFSLR